MSTFATFALTVLFVLSTSQSTYADDALKGDRQTARAACAPDEKAVCSDITPGGGRPS